MKTNPMIVPRFKVGDRVRMIPETEWRGVVIARHRHRNNGYKVRALSSPNPFDPPGHEFWTRPVNLQRDT